MASESRSPSPDTPGSATDPTAPVASAVSTLDAPASSTPAGDASAAEQPQPDALVARRERLSSAKRALIEKRLRRQDEPDPTASPPIPPRPPHELVPLSLAQEPLWLQEQLAPGTTLYNLFRVERLSGPFDMAAFRASLHALLQRHESLRTAFVLRDGQPIQQIAPDVPLPLTVVDLHMLPLDAQRVAVQRVANTIQRPFDLDQAPLLRVALVQFADDEHMLLLAIHHLIADAWSMDLLLHELLQLYTARAAGQPDPLTALPIQYADFAIWQRQQLQGARLDAQIAYWQTQLAGAPPQLELTTDHPRPSAQTFRAGQLPFALPAPLAQALSGLARQEQATLFMVLLAAFQALLGRYSGQTDVVVGTPSAGRTHPSLEGVMGCFINTLALRADLGGNPTFRTLLRQVRATFLDAAAHQEIPFTKLIEVLQPVRPANCPPIFQVLFDLRPIPVTPGPVTPEGDAVEQGPELAIRYDLILLIQAAPDGLTGVMQYNTELFEAPTIERMLGHFATLLEGIGADPDRPILDLPLLDAAERHQLLVEWNATTTAYPRDLCIQQLFERQAAQAPDAVAVIFDGRPTTEQGSGVRGQGSVTAQGNLGAASPIPGPEYLTYRELNQQANQLARHLAALGVGPGSFVAVFMDRTPELIGALLGILKAGGAYVPLEAGLPPARVQAILAALQVRWVLTQSAQVPALDALCPQLPALQHVLCLDAAPLEPGADEQPDAAATGVRYWSRADLAALPVEDLPPRAGPDDLAYVIFTSGSTGTPKGVMVAHRPVINLIDWVNRTFAIGAADRVLFVTAIGFDLSVYDIFGLLAAGGSVRVAAPEEVRDPARLIEIVCDEPITFWDSAPAALQQLVPFFPAPGAAAGAYRLRLVFLSGDWIPVPLPDQVRNSFPAAQVISLGGATEATVWSNFYPVGVVGPNWTSIPYGRPIQNARYYILDPRLEPCPVGVPGELYIGGECLAAGYANDPILTAAKFIADPFADQRPTTGASTQNSDRLYRTGDRARFFPDGNIEFLGRVDQQVKLRGFRIELGEIETVLGAHPAVQTAAVLLHRATPTGPRLVAYVVTSDKSQVTSTEDSSLVTRHSSLVAELRAFLEGQLPAYMVPSAFVLLDTLPVTPNGKLDRTALRRIALTPATPDATYVAPRTPTESTLAEIWADILGVSPISADANFFDLGGHSLLLNQIMFRIQAAFPVELPWRTVFEAPTLAALAQTIDQAVTTGTLPAAPELDLFAEAQLDPALLSGPLPPTRQGAPATILLTGATGFLGAFVLMDLLRRYEATIICLVRAPDADAAAERLRRNLATYRLPETLPPRVVALPGDLAQPQLGLDAATWGQLAQSVDEIYHCAASVNLLYPYAYLKAANVDATRELLRLAATDQLKALHYVSTTEVLKAIDMAHGPLLHENLPLDRPDQLQGGYPQTKWVAEQLVMQAGARGLPVTIFRPGRISGDSHTGAYNPHELFGQLVKGLVRMGSAPDIGAGLELAPVDFVSQSLVELAGRPEGRGRAFHLFNPRVLPFGELARFMKEGLGYELRQVGIEQWRQDLFDEVARTQDETLSILMRIYFEPPEPKPEAPQAEAPEKPHIHRHFDCQVTLEELARSGIACPEINATRLRAYFDYLTEIGWMPPAPAAPALVEQG